MMDYSAYLIDADKQLAQASHAASLGDYALALAYVRSAYETVSTLARVLQQLVLDKDKPKLQ